MRHPILAQMQYTYCQLEPTKMIRQDFSRIDPKRRSTLGHRQKQFAQPTYQELQYPHRLNFYTVPPTADITLEQFEQWAIDRLRGA
jgi:DNA primase large subunit